MVPQELSALPREVRPFRVYGQPTRSRVHRHVPCQKKKAAEGPSSLGLSASESVFIRGSPSVFQPAFRITENDTLGVFIRIVVFCVLSALCPLP